MGLSPDYLDLIERSAVSQLGGLAGMRMLELGDQTIRTPGIPERTGKEYFENRGVDHTSFDLNAKNGALPVDLAQPIEDSRWLGAFDIVTNAGTTEHVEPYEAQYVCFRSIHDCLKVGGIAVHVVPDLDELEQHGSWANHCNNYYTDAFFRRLAELNGYTLISSQVMNGNRCVCLRKTTDAPFTASREEVLAGIGRRTGGKVYSGINAHRLLGPLPRAIRGVSIFIRRRILGRPR
jgi:SAM-dependent methyltransferase